MSPFVKILQKYLSWKTQHCLGTAGQGLYRVATQSSVDWVDGPIDLGLSERWRILFVCLGALCGNVQHRQLQSHE